jgi:RNA polymerase sigma-70 factor (ECF subfamily)
MTEHPSTLEDKHRHLRTCLEKLPERSRRVIDMKYTERRKIEDIAASIKKSGNATRLLLFRIRKAIAKCLSAVRVGEDNERGVVA